MLNTPAFAHSLAILSGGFYIAGFLGTFVVLVALRGRGGPTPPVSLTPYEAA